VLYEPFGRRGQPHAASGPLQEGDSGFGFQRAELLGYCRGSVGQGGGDGRQRAAVFEFSQQAEPVQVKHGRLQNR
jgi:hypothetical protein